MFESHCDSSGFAFKLRWESSLCVPSVGPRQAFSALGPAVVCTV